MRGVAHLRPPTLFALATAAIAGVAAAEARSIAPIASLAVLSSAALLALLARRRPGLSALILACALGLLRGAAGREAAGRDRAAIDRSRVELAQAHAGVVRGPVLESHRGYRAVLDTASGPVLLTAVGAGPRPLPGDRVSARGRLSTEPRFLGDPAAIERERRRVESSGAVARLVTGADRVSIGGASGSGAAWRAAARVQRRASAMIRARAPGSDGAAVVAALATGDRSAIGDRLSRSLRRAGVAHLLAVSGLHIGALAWLVFAAVRRIWPGVTIDADVVASVLALAAAAGFAIITGARPSALRALLVVAVLLAGRARALRARVVDALGLAAIALVAVEPAVVFDPSFQMSFAAAAALSLAFAGRRPARTWRGRVWSLAVASAWATAATAPFAAPLFGEIAPIAVLTNIVAIPLVAFVILPLAIAGLAIGPLLDVSIGAAELICRGSAWVAAAVPAAPVPGFSPLETLGWLAALVLVLRGRRAAIAGVVVGIAVAASALSPPARSGLRVTFVDVGQGDAALIETPGGASILIDVGGLAGGRSFDRRAVEIPGARAVLPLLRRRGVRRLDVVALSHPHPDHFGGLGALIGEVDIDEVWTVEGSPELDATLRALAVGGARVRVPPRSVALGGVELEILAPRYLGAVAADPVSSVNDNSLVIAVGYAGRRVLFAGDIEADGEELLLADRRDRLRADVVKVAHHGSPTSSIPGFVAATGAAEAIISCGRHNRFGFPDGEVVDRWRRAGARVTRTDVVGSIELSIDPFGRVALRAAAPVGVQSR